MNLKEIIKNYPDYPKKGVNFKDIWPLFRDQNALEHIINTYKNEFKEVDYFAGIEARGFTFASILAFELKKVSYLFEKRESCQERRLKQNMN